VVHLLTDAAVSAAVLVSALLMPLLGWPWLDAATAIGVGLAVAWSGWELLGEALSASLDAVPRGIDLAAVETALRSLPGVENVHHLHIWGMSTSRTALTAHLGRATAGGDDGELLQQAQQRLADLGITHSTIQIEPPGGCLDNQGREPE
jgi:cobalt-zinc-cadmium efflux system protein